MRIREGTVALETEEFVLGATFLAGGLAVLGASILLGSRWWFAVGGFVIVAAMKGYAWSGPLDEYRLARGTPTAEWPRLRWPDVLMRLLPCLVFWFALDGLLLWSNPDVAGAAGAGWSVGVGLANLRTTWLIGRYERAETVTLISEAPRFYLFWRRPDVVLRGPR